MTQKNYSPKKLFLLTPTPLLRITLVLMLASMPFAAQAAHESDQDLAAPASILVTINGTNYVQKTISIADSFEANRTKHSTTISTLNGLQVSCIEYPDYCTVYCQLPDNGGVTRGRCGRISWVKVEKAFRDKKLGTGRHLIEFVHNFYQQKNFRYVKLTAFPCDLTQDDVKLPPRERTERLVNYYKSLGYDQLGELEDDRGVNMICYLPQHAQDAQPEPTPQPE